MSLLDTASLIVTPNGYKEGKLYSVIPSDGSGDLSVTRATTATRVNSAGLVELVPYNLVNYSEQFDNAYWTKYNVTITANTNETTDPIGGNTADIFVSSNSTNAMGMEGNVAYTQNSRYTLTIYAKYKNTPFIQMLAPSFVSSDYVNFNIQTGAVVGGSYSLTPTVTNVGNGWYRCSFTFVANYTGTTAIGATYLVDSASSTRGQAFTGDGVKGAYIWGAQLNEGTIKPYQKTETRLNIPRLDYSNGTCPSILVEPQRTNLLTYSSSFDNSDWTKSNINLTANSVVSPSGVQDADLITENTINGSHVIYRSVTGTSNTFSFYAKPNGRNWVGVLSNNGDASFFNIANGTLGTIAATSTATIEDAGNGWYRCTVYNTHPTFGASIYISTGNGVTDYLGDGTSGVYIWGAQLEAGSYATSYIPTTSASVTRNADVISKTGISSLIGQTEGTLFIDAFFGTGYDSNNMLMTLSDGGTNNIIYINRSNGGSEFYTAVSGATQAVYSGSILSAGVHKIAVAYKQNDFAMYVDGVQVFTDTSGNIPACNKLNIGSYANGGLLYNDGIKAAALWTTRLTNTQLAQLTTI